MRRKYFENELTEAAKVIIRYSKDPKEIKRAQAIYLPNELGMSYEETAQALQCTRRTVSNLRRSFYRVVMLERPILPPGGRKHENLTIEEELAFLEEMSGEAEAGRISTVVKIHKEYEKRIGKKANPSTVYRLLKRHGWRKLEPRRQHPDSDPQAQEAFKRDIPGNHAAGNGKS